MPGRTLSLLNPFMPEEIVWYTFNDTTIACRDVSLLSAFIRILSENILQEYSITFIISTARSATIALHFPTFHHLHGFIHYESVVIIIASGDIPEGSARVAAIMILVSHQVNLFSVRRKILTQKLLFRHPLDEEYDM